MLVIRLLSSFYWGRQKTFEVIGSISSVYTTCSFEAYLLARTVGKLFSSSEWHTLTEIYIKIFSYPERQYF